MGLERGLLPGLVVLVLGCSAAKADSPEEALFQALAQKCPQARWSHATMGAYQQPLDVAAYGLSPDEANALEESARNACRGVVMGEWCDNKGRIEYLAKIGRLEAMVQAFCAVKPDTFD
jgi:hypothetical protein